MKPSIELFSLIKSLSKSEKRFFKLSSSLQSGEKNYLKIFDAIEKQNDYDEEAIKDQFAKETFIKHFPSEKNHLYKLILKSLRSYHSDNSPASALKQEIKNIEILYKKALFKECNKFLGRAKKVAEENEKFYFSVDLINWEKSLLEEAFEQGEFDVSIQELIAEEHDVIAKLTNLAEYQVLYSKINYIFRLGGFVKNQAERDEVDAIMEHPLIKDPERALSVRAQSILYYVRGFCYNARRDNENSISSFLKVKEVLDGNNPIRYDLQKRYVRAVANVVSGYISVKNYEAATTYLEELNALKKNKAFQSRDIEISLFFNTRLLSLLLFNRQGKYEEAVDYCNNLAHEIEKMESDLNKEKKIVFYYLIAYIYFADGQLREALQWINKVLNDNESNLRQDIYSYSRIFNLMIHYELGNFDLLEYIIKSTNRYLNKSDRDYEFETTLVDYIKRLAKNQPEDERVAIFKELSQELGNRFTNPYNRVVLEYIDFKSWISAKIEGKPFAEMVKLRGVTKK